MESNTNTNNKLLIASGLTMGAIMAQVLFNYYTNKPNIKKEE
jgi:hypothetical protein